MRCRQQKEKIEKHRNTTMKEAKKQPHTNQQTETEPEEEHEPMGLVDLNEGKRKDQEGWMEVSNRKKKPAPQTTQ